ncbi:MAG: ABC transporter substrate-binding protein [Nitrospirae bacterium]|nr:ABC transporter substrate-binding protein [Nitrospirota bacterium]
MNILRLLSTILLFITLLASQTLAAEKTIGVILTGNTPFYQAIHKAFLEELKRRGIKAEILVQTPSSETMAWVNAARKVVTVNVDIIVTYGTSATVAAVSETSEIPVVFSGVFDPETVGRKRNVTGASSKVPLIGIVKLLKDLKDFARLGIIYNDTEKDTVKQATEIEGLGSKFSFQPVKFNIKRLGDTQKIKDIDALILTTCCAAFQCIDNIVEVSRRLKVPTATAISGGEETGIILTVSADPVEQGKDAAELVARVIAGEKPSSIPFKSPKKVDMIINLKEANELGIKVPLDVLGSATKVIK